MEYYLLYKKRNYRPSKTFSENRQVAFCCHFTGDYIIYIYIYIYTSYYFILIVNIHVNNTVAKHRVLMLPMIFIISYTYISVKGERRIQTIGNAGNNGNMIKIIIIESKLNFIP